MCAAFCSRRAEPETISKSIFPELSIMLHRFLYCNRNTRCFGNHMDIPVDFCPYFFSVSISEAAAGRSGAGRPSDSAIITGLMDTSPAPLRRRRASQPPWPKHFAPCPKHLSQRGTEHKTVHNPRKLSNFPLLFVFSSVFPRMPRRAAGNFFAGETFPFWQQYSAQIPIVNIITSFLRTN